jgi:hypothetical protein
VKFNPPWAKSPRQKKDVMEKLNEASCTNSDLILNVKKKDVRRFKAGAELSGKVNKMDVTFNEDITDEAHEFKITLVLKSERCSK